MYYSDKGDYLTAVLPTYEAIESSLRFNRTFQVTVIGTILVYDLLLILLLVLNAASFESPEVAKKQNGRSQLLSFGIQFKSMVIFVPEVVILTQVYRGSPEDTGGILLFVGSTACLAISCLIEFIVTYLLNIRVRLIEEIPWCSQKSFFPLILSFFKLAHGVCLTVDIPQASIIVLFLIAILTAAVFTYLQPFHNSRVHLIHLVFLSILVAEYFHLLIAMFSGDLMTPIITVVLFFLSGLAPPLGHVIVVTWQERLQ